METPVQADNLDPTTFAEWVDGRETPLSGADRSQTPQWLIWTDKTQPGHSALTFGDSKTPGARHLRIGFKNEVAIGSVLVRGGGQLSVLKAGAVYPGDPGSEANWIPAQRLDKGEVSAGEVAKQEVALWTFPPGTQTRALRFTHVAEASDAAYAGFLGGAFVMSERWINLAEQALAGAGANAQDATRINNGADDTGKPWDNLDNRQPAPETQPLVSPRDPQWVMLTWPAAVKIGGLNALGAGFGASEVQIYAGPADRHPRDAGDSDWKSIGNFTGLKNGYPVQLWPNPLIFGQVVTTRAIRVKMTAPSEEGHPHLKGATKGGKRVWLGELMALQPLENTALQAVKFPVTDDGPRPPIAVRFKLKEPGYVTLVIEKPDGVRVRNLVSETHFPAGENLAWWDGTDDLGRDLDAAGHGVYKIPAQFVVPGTYRVRGLVRGAIEPHYEFSIYSAGDPAWETMDKAGGWLTNHTPPQAAIFVPAEKSPTGAGMVYLGSAVSEGGAGLAWVDLDGKKIGGRGWIGGNWTAAPYLARDEGRKAVPEVFAYVGATWTASASNTDKTHGELRITALTANADKPVIKHPFTPPAHDASGGGGDNDWVDQLGGLAACDGLLVASMHKLGVLLFIDAHDGKVLGEARVESPRGLAFDAQGRLLVLSGATLLRYAVNASDPAKLVTTAPLIARGLDDPRGITLDAQGNILISDGGASHQVKVFTPEGKFVRAIGKAGAPTAGPYDPLHMNNPAGMAVDPNGRLWVTENDFLPKRVSVWNADGTLWKAFYGPAKYGGGGTLDSQDKTRFYYADEGRGSMEFKLDWNKGESQLVSVLYRPQPGDLTLPFRSAAPELPLTHDGRRYFANCYNSNPTGGHGTAFLFVEKDGIARPAAAIGRTKDWELLQTETFASRLPAGADWKKNPPLFIWSDANGDAQVQPEEVTFQAGEVGGITVMPDLSFCVARVGDKAMRFAPTGFAAGGAPLYDLAKGETLAEGVQPPASSGGDQVLAGSDGWTVVTLGIAPFARHSLSGAKNGQPQWSYPNLWPGLHASHEAPEPDRPGELIGPTRLMGGFISPRNSDAGEIWGINANMGTAYLFTADGLFVATLFKDKREGKSWTMPVAKRNISLEGVTLHEENFWPTLTQTSDGQVYLMNGGRAALVRLDGLETIRRLPDTMLRVGPDELQKAQAYLVAAEAQRQQSQGRGVLEIALRATAPTVDGKLDDWAGAAWVDIDKSGVAANFNSNSKPYDVTAAVSISGDRLYAAFRTGNDKLLQNSGAVPNAPFKTGGALDLMLGVNPAADPKRAAPVVGDLRLLVTMAQGKPLAVLYQAVVPGTKNPVPFSSPWRTITLDRTDDVSAQVQLAGAGGNYELSIPLAALGLKPQAGQSLKGDIGILRGDGSETTARVYWSNKATGITSDVPSEAILTPQLWGRVELKAAP
jgi:hypothetical protein